MVWINVGLVDAGLGSAATTTVVILVRPSDVHGHHPAIVPAACAVARACPIFSAKAQDPSSPARHVVVGFVGTEAPTCLLCGTQVSLVAPAAFDAVRLTARLAETPAEQMSCAQVETEAKQLLHGLPNVAVSSLVGDQLTQAGLNAIHTVGRTAIVPPRLVVLKLTPSDPDAARRDPIGLVGKGIVYDTGGLNLKSDGGRLMKDDMTGAAGVLGAFWLLATVAAKDPSLELKAPLYAALCLAENAIGPKSYRPDDIIRMHSGLTVEVTDTDAEGRFVVGDGCSFLAREKGCKTVIDAATLTGTTNFTAKQHAAVMSSHGCLEKLVVQAGLQSGEHVVPMIWVPEALEEAMSSPVADMVNDNEAIGVYSSIGGYFIYSQVKDVPGVRWAHIDLGVRALCHRSSRSSTQ